MNRIKSWFFRLKLKLIERYVRKWADNQLQEEMDAMTTAFNQAMGLINLKDSTITSLNDAMGKMHESHESETYQLEKIIVALILHAGGEAVVGRSIREHVDNATFTIEEFEDQSLCFKAEPLEESLEELCELSDD